MDVTGQEVRVVCTLNNELLAGWIISLDVYATYISVVTTSCVCWSAGDVGEIAVALSSVELIIDAANTETLSLIEETCEAMDEAVVANVGSAVDKAIMEPVDGVGTGELLTRLEGLLEVASFETEEADEGPRSILVAETVVADEVPEFMLATEALDVDTLLQLVLRTALNADKNGSEVAELTAFAAEEAVGETALGVSLLDSSEDTMVVGDINELDLALLGDGDDDLVVAASDMVDLLLLDSVDEELVVEASDTPMLEVATSGKVLCTEIPVGGTDIIDRGATLLLVWIGLRLELTVLFKTLMLR